MSSRAVARIIEHDDKSLVDVIDNLLNRGVVLTADLILALADVDLVYVRLSAILCAADRVLPDGPAQGSRLRAQGSRKPKAGGLKPPEA